VGFFYAYYDYLILWLRLLDYCLIVFVAIQFLFFKPLVGIGAGAGFLPLAPIYLSINIFLFALSLLLYCF